MSHTIRKTVTAAHLQVGDILVSEVGKPELTSVRVTNHKVGRYSLHGQRHTGHEWACTVSSDDTFHIDRQVDVEHAFADEEEAKLVRRALIGIGNRVSSLAYDATREVWAFDVTGTRPTPYVNELEVCYVRALDAMGKVQKLRDSLVATLPLNPVTDRRRVLAELDAVLAAFQGE